MDVDTAADEIEYMFDGDLEQALSFVNEVRSRLRTRKNAEDFAEKEVGGD